MNDYVEVRIDLDPCNEDITDVLAALLADVGFESFVPDGAGLTAYIQAGLYDESMSEITDALPFECRAVWTAGKIEGRDWNHEWERNYFKPIVVADKCVIHSSFHTDIPKCQYDITIDPKMAFGTGHHATTSLILRQLLDMDLNGVSVIDMGTGTGILAILSAMRGAEKVIGVEIDEAAYVNAIDNVRLNGHPEIELVHGCADSLQGIGWKADLLLANINRNVITSDLPAYVKSLKPGATVIFSGFYMSDVPVVEKSAVACGLALEGVTSLDNWACMRLVFTSNQSNHAI